jgi:hypothetical protein
MSENSQTPPLLRPQTEDLARIANEVSEISEIQRRLADQHKNLKCPDRVAHQYQIAGGKVLFRVTDSLPTPLNGVGLFQANEQYIGIGRISTGLGTPHIETNPDFLGARVSFMTKDGQRVDFLGLNDPGAPTANHRDFIDVLHATGEAAGAEMPLIGDWGAYDVGNLLAEQKEVATALAKRMGLIKGGKTLAHIVKQSLRTIRSSTAYQTYWTGIVEVSQTLGKFTLVPIKDENHSPGLRPGERHLSQDWRQRQSTGDLEFSLYWIPYLNEDETSTEDHSKPWKEDHKQRIGAIIFPKTDLESQESRLWATLASETGANPGNWVSDKGNTIKEPSTEFGIARKLAYELSHKGRNVLELNWYQSVFSSGQISPELSRELVRRQEAKDSVGHVNWAPLS